MADNPHSTRYETVGGSYGTGHETAHAEGAHAEGRMARISWGAVIAGTVVALVVYLMLSLLGIGVGAATLEFGTAAQIAPEGLGIGAAVWWILSVLIALFIGGWFAGYLSGIPEKQNGAVHGIVTWGLTILLSAWFTTTAIGAVAGGAFNVLEGGMTMLGQQQISPEMLERIEDPELRQQLEETMAGAQQDVQAIADDVTEAVAQAGIWGFIGMLLAAVVAALGGLLGAVMTPARAAAHPGGERREERGREREREREPERGRYDYERERAERAERERTERAERERAEREREGAVGREGYEREPGEPEREQQRQRLERERAERERERERYDQP